MAEKKGLDPIVTQAATEVAPLIVESEAEQLLGEKPQKPEVEPLVEELETEGVLEEDDEASARELRVLLGIEEKS